MIEVESTSVRAIGYDADTLTLAVQYRNGSLYVWPEIPAEVHRKFMAAKSKGRFLATFKHAIRAKEPLNPHTLGDALKAVNEVARDAGVIGSLETHETDECCGTAISKAMRDGWLLDVQLWICPKCGETWAPSMVGTVRHWAMRPSWVTNAPKRR